MRETFIAIARSLPDVEWFVGGTAEINGDLKMEWRDPKTGLQYLGERELAVREEQARTALVQGRGEWWYNRNAHYNAECGLEMLQEEKLRRGIKLDLDHKPVLREASAVCPSRQKHML